MTNIFTLDEMIKALRKIGYEINEVEEIGYTNYPGWTSEEKFNTYSISYKGNSFDDVIPPRLSGDQKVLFVFEQELKKKILLLFGN